MRRSFVPLVLSAALALSACGSSSSSKGAGAGVTDSTGVEVFSSPSYEKAGPTPSKSAKMVCQKEARDDIAVTLGVKETSVTKPVWVKAQHLYSCTYVYPKGRITLTVKELVDAGTTTAYFETLQTKYGTTQQLIGLGQGAWILKNNDVLVRKDYKVLFVDVHGIPPTFGLAMTRSDVATNIAVAIMGCWKGA